MLINIQVCKVLSMDCLTRRRGRGACGSLPTVRRSEAKDPGKATLPYLLRRYFAVMYFSQYLSSLDLHVPALITFRNKQTIDFLHC